MDRKGLGLNREDCKGTETETETEQDRGTGPTKVLQSSGKWDGGVTIGVRTLPLDLGPASGLSFSAAALRLGESGKGKMGGRGMQNGGEEGTMDFVAGMGRDGME